MIVVFYNMESFKKEINNLCDSFISKGYGFTSFDEIEPILQVERCKDLVNNEKNMVVYSVSPYVFQAIKTLIILKYNNLDNIDFYFPRNNKVETVRDKNGNLNDGIIFKEMYKAYEVLDNLDDEAQERWYKEQDK